MKGARACRTDYFSENAAIAAFEFALVEHLREVMKVLTSRFIPPENVQHLRHGDDWKHPGLPDAVSSGMKQHTTEMVLKFQDLVDHDLGAINRHVQQIAGDMTRQFQQMMYGMISTTCDQTGNVIDAKAEGGALEGFAAMLEKIKFSADKNGEVKRPEVHMHPEAYKWLKEAEKTASPELLKRIQDADARKIAEAIEEETQRKRRFVRYGEDTF